MKFRFSLSALFVCTFLSAVAVRGGIWGYEEFWLPNRPIAWQPYDAVAIEHARQQGRTVLVHYVCECNLDSQVVLNGTFELPEVRLAVHTNNVLPVLVRVAPTGADVGSEELPLVLFHTSGANDPPVRLTGIPTGREMVAAIQAVVGRKPLPS